jgi:hypothetical protein
MTVQEFREVVQSLLGPQTGLPPMSKAVLDSLYFNTAQHVVESIDLPWLRGDESQNVVAGQADYYLPTTLHFPLSLHLYNTSEQQWWKMDAVLPEDAIQVVGDEEVTKYAHCGIETADGGDRGRWKIKLFPTPTVAITNGLRVLFKKKPTKLASHPSDSSEIIEFPESLLMGMAYRCAWLWASRMGAPGATKDIGVYLQFYEEEMRRINARFGSLHTPDVRPAQHSSPLGIVL